MVCLFGSISTIIWGALFGGWFGLEWHPLLFVPMNEPLKMLALCFGLGILHLALGMLTKAYLLIRDGDIMGAVCDQFSWLILFTGLSSCRLYQAVSEKISPFWALPSSSYLGDGIRRES